MKKLIAVLALLAACSANASQWRFVDISESGMMMLAQTPTTSYNNGVVKTVWVKTVKSNGEIHTVTLSQYHCASKMYSNNQITVYNNGNYSYSFNPNPSNSWTYVVPDTMGVTLLEWACAR